MAIPILLYDIMLISDYQDLHALISFCTDKDLSLKADKTKVMLFNITEPWEMKSEPDFFLGEEKMAYT